MNFVLHLFSKEPNLMGNVKCVVLKGFVEASPGIATAAGTSIRHFPSNQRPVRRARRKLTEGSFESLAGVDISVEGNKESRYMVAEVVFPSDEGTFAWTDSLQPELPGTMTLMGMCLDDIQEDSPEVAESATIFQRFCSGLPHLLKAVNVSMRRRLFLRGVESIQYFLSAPSLQTWSLLFPKKSPGDVKNLPRCQIIRLGGGGLQDELSSIPQKRDAFGPELFSFLTPWPRLAENSVDGTPLGFDAFGSPEHSLLRQSKILGEVLKVELANHTLGQDESIAPKQSQEVADLR